MPGTLSLQRASSRFIGAGCLRYVQGNVFQLCELTRD